jgi:hypothetical protein
MIAFTRLIRDCPSPYPGGTCGCGCGCTSPAEAAFGDELDKLLREKADAERRLRAANDGLDSLLRRGIPARPKNLRMATYADR